MSDLFIHVQRVSKVYRMGEIRIPALTDVELAIERGEFLAVWGPSGSGKSTLCNLLGLIDECTEGEIDFDGTRVSALSDDQRSEFRNHKIGFVFQGFNLMPVLSALENVMLPLVIRGGDQGAASERSRELLDQLGLGGHLHHRPQKLSGGQQQRVAIARALISDPMLVLADEPTANLDSKTAGGIIDAMREMNASRGTTFLFSTHDQRLLGRVDRRLLLEDGRITEDGRTPDPGPGGEGEAA